MAWILTWAPAAALIWAVISTIVAWAFASGRFTGRTVTLDQLNAALIEKGVVTEAVLLRRLEAERHSVRDELNAATGKCVPRELYTSEHLALANKVDRLERAFDGARQND